jgi:hypothetical protein
MCLQAPGLRSVGAHLRRSKPWVVPEGPGRVNMSEGRWSGWKRSQEEDTI